MRQRQDWKEVGREGEGNMKSGFPTCASMTSLEGKKGEKPEDTCLI